MSSPPKSLVKSRENLQVLFKDPHKIIKYEIFDRLLSQLWGNIRQSLVKSQKYIINIHDPSYYGKIGHGFDFTEAIVLEFIEILKKEYPGVDFTYKETAGYDGRILEKIIVMDWS
jgi:hypothetical protein